MHARREREKRHPHSLARSRSQRSVVGNIQPNGQKKTLDTHPTRTRLSSGKIPGLAQGFPPVPLRLRSHTLTSIRRVHTPHALIKRKHIQRKLVPRHEPTRPGIGTTVHPDAQRLTTTRSRSGTAESDADLGGSCAVDDGNDCTRARDNNAADAPLPSGVPPPRPRQERCLLIFRGNFRLRT